MPNFANPFQGNVNRKMTNAELMQAIRLDIAGELEAIYLYESHILATDDLAAKKYWRISAMKKRRTWAN